MPSLSSGGVASGVGKWLHTPGRSAYQPLPKLPAPLEKVPELLGYIPTPAIPEELSVLPPSTGELPVLPPSHPEAAGN